MITEARIQCMETLPVFTVGDHFLTRNPDNADRAAWLLSAAGLDIADDRQGLRVTTLDGQQATIEFEDSRFLTELALRRDRALFDGFVDGAYRISDETDVPDGFDTGDIQSDGLINLFRGFLRARSKTDPILYPYGDVKSFIADGPQKQIRRLARWLDDNGLSGRDKGNIGAHYDIDDDLYYHPELGFLGKELQQYSCGLELTGLENIEELDRNKVERIIELLDLKPGMRVAEIGTGSGGLMQEIIKHMNGEVEVVSVTLSEVQKQFAEARLEQQGLQAHGTVKLQHYRQFAKENEGQFDRVVSVEMIEAVDWRDSDDYAEAVARLLNKEAQYGAKAVIQSINDPHERFNLAKRQVGYVKGVVFPGGVLHSVESQRRSFRKAGMHEIYRNDITDGYPPTLQSWRAEFNRGWGQLRQHWLDRGVNESDIRRFHPHWNLYLASSTAQLMRNTVTAPSFVNGYINGTHIQDNHIVYELAA